MVGGHFALTEVDEPWHLLGLRPKPGTSLAQRRPARIVTAFAFGALVFSKRPFTAFGSEMAHDAPREHGRGIGEGSWPLLRTTDGDLGVSEPDEFEEFAALLLDSVISVTRRRSIELIAETAA